MTDRDKISAESLNRILSEFSFCGDFLGYVPYGAGHINDTFLLTFRGVGGEVKYILQRINSRIFRDIPSLMRNFELVTDFLGRRAAEMRDGRLQGGQGRANEVSEELRGGQCCAAETSDGRRRDVLTLIFTKSGKSFVEVGGEFFRSFVFIDGATAYQSVEKPAHFYQAGRAFGKFAVMLSGFDASQLYESIPRFHDTENRFESFLAALKADVLNRAAGVRDEIAFTLKRREIVGKIVGQLREKCIPLRVTHNDTKLNNVMIDDKTEKAAAVIDLDTVMPGSLLYDFGDSIRSGCNTGAEDEKDLAKVAFDFALFETYADGYIGEVGGIMTEKERELTGFAPLLMTFECGMRFLTDYLDGDNYFKIKYPGHNLDRARTQYKLVADMEQNEGKIEEILSGIFKKYGI
jgi:hypothetical protein